MQLSDIRASLERTNGHRAQFRGEGVVLDSLKANGTDDNDTGQRVRKEAREAEGRVLSDIIYNAEAVGWINHEIQDAAVRLAKIEQTRDALELDDSSDALDATFRLAEAALVELTTLRTALLRTIIASASTLAPKDGHTHWGDTPSGEVFPSGPEIFGEPEPDQVEVLTEQFDSARAAAAAKGDSNFSDDELAQLLGVY